MWVMAHSELYTGFKREMWFMNLSYKQKQIFQFCHWVHLAL